MADTVYSMNQYRYNGDGKSKDSTCMKDKFAEPKYLDWKIDSETSPYYRDIIVGLTTDDKWGTPGFTENHSYYFTFGVPRDLNYDYNIAVKLLDNYNDYIYESTKTPYQFIKYICARKTSDNGTSNSLVVLYETITEEGELPNHPKTAIQHCERTVDGKGWKVEVNPTRPQKVEESGFFYEVLNVSIGYCYYPNVLYHNQITDTYWMFKNKNGGDDPWIVPGKENADGETIPDDPFGKKDDDNHISILAGTKDIILNWSWTVSETTNMSYYKLIFTPTKQFFYVVLQLERIAEDKDIITDKIVAGDGSVSNTRESSGDSNHPGQGQTVYGRYINLDQKTGNMKEDGVTPETVKDTFKIYDLTDLNAGILKTDGAAIKRLGIWGHPELMMAINGEEIQIGQSGYYELNDFNVQSFAVAANGIKDSFVLDYQYAI